jgi:hypothetical protein
MTLPLKLKKQKTAALFPRDKTPSKQSRKRKAATEEGEKDTKTADHGSKKGSNGACEGHNHDDNDDDDDEEEDNSSSDDDEDSSNSDEDDDEENSAGSKNTQKTETTDKALDEEEEAKIKSYLTKKQQLLTNATTVLCGKHKKALYKQAMKPPFQKNR